MCKIQQAEVEYDGCVGDNNHAVLRDGRLRRSSSNISSVKEGKLGDLAPTILHLMGVSIPSEMTGDLLVS